MKRMLILCLAMAATMTTFSMAAKTSRTLSHKIIVASDPHLMAPELAMRGSEAFDKYAESDMRMIAQSNEIVQTWVEAVVKKRPTLVIISGDLTKDGEQASHERMASYLARLQAAGIKTLVIPGNHDISNPNAKRFVGDKTEPAATIDRETFAHIYANAGYGSDAVRDTASLSYVVKPAEGLVVIGIDSNLDEQNLLKSRGDSVDSYHNAGIVKSATIAWIGEQARRAVAEGNDVFAVMHHHAVEHFDSESRVLPNYVLQNAAELRQTLADAGVHIILTGHLHINDAARAFVNGGDSITEVATGSLITYPFAYREITVSNHTMSIETSTIGSIKSMRSLKQRGREKLEKAAPALISGIFNRAWNKVSGKLGQLAAFMGSMNGESSGFDMGDKPEGFLNAVRENFGDLAAEALIAVADGNESKADADRIIDRGKERIMTMVNRFMPGGAYFGNFFIDEVFSKVEPLIRSLLEDKNNIGTARERVVNDLKVKLEIGTGHRR